MFSIPVSHDRTSVRKMQRELLGKAQKAAAKKMGWPKSMRQFAKRYGQGATDAQQLHAQLGDLLK